MLDYDLSCERSVSDSHFKAFLNISNLNSFTVTGDNDRIIANSIDPDETAHPDLRRLTFSLSTLRGRVSK